MEFLPGLLDVDEIFLVKNLFRKVLVDGEEKEDPEIENAVKTNRQATIRLLKRRPGLSGERRISCYRSRNVFSSVFSRVETRTAPTQGRRTVRTK